MKQITTAAVLAAMFLMMSSIVIAQTPLKITHKPSAKVPVCNVPGKKFKIRNADDQAVCDELRKPNPKGNSVPPQQNIGSPNPISNPPTGN
jgi:hypothetical protein